MSASLGLFRLQKVDSQISQIDAQLAKIQAALENEEEIQSAKAKVKAAEKCNREAELALHNLEAEVQDRQIKIQQAEASLYGGSIHNPKELQDLQADVVSLKKQLASLEEHQLEEMIRVDGTQSELRNANHTLEIIQTQSRTKNQHLIDEQTALRRDLESLNSERQAAVSAVANSFLTTYDNLRKQRRGIAVAEVADNACGACGTTLTAALQQNARHTTELVLCPSCGRILYAA